MFEEKLLTSMPLDQVPGVSHCDLYQAYLPELHSMAKDREVNNQITLQDLVEMKKWIAEKEEVEIIEPSKIETALVFVRAGGNFETGKVSTEDVFHVLEGRALENPGIVSMGKMNRARAMANWD